MMLIKDAVRFLSQIPPFQFLEGPLLRKVSQSLTMEFYPKGSVILQQDGPVSESLRIIQKGVVKITLRPKGSGEEVVVDYRERGETFGLVSLMGGHQKTTIVAMQDTICYLLPRDQLNEMMSSHPAIMAPPELPDPDYGPGFHRPIAPSRRSRIPGIARAINRISQPSRTQERTR